MTRLHPVAVALSWMGVVCYFTVSGNLLDVHGWAYSLAGGSVFAKVHPGTYCVLAATLVLLGSGNPVRVAGGIAQEMPASAGFLVVVVGLASYVLSRFGTSGSAFLLDLHVAPVLMAILLYRFTPEQASRLLAVAVALLAVDAVIGIAEFALKARVTPYLVDGKPVQEAYFRATSLLGHPLQNALAMSIGIAILPGLRGHRVAAVGAGLLMAGGLIAFGGRSALAVTAVLILLAAPIAAIRSMARQQFGYRTLTGVALGVLTLLTAAGAAAVAFGSQTRVLSGLRWDASANTRLLGLRILDRVSPLDLVFGIGPQEVRRRTEILGDYHGIIGLENSWLLLFLIFGGIGLLIFGVGLLTWLWSLLRRGPAAGWLATIAYLVVASTNNTLASKDTTLVLLVVLIFGARGAAAAAGATVRDAGRQRAGPVPA